MTESNRRRAILRIALPAIITNITTPILGMADVAIAGRMGSGAYIGAIAVGSAIFNMIYWLLNFLRAGTSGMTAQAYGARDIAAMREILRRSLTLGGAIGAAVLLLSPLIAAVFIPFMEADAATAPIAEEYFLTVIWGAPAYIATYAVSGWLLGNQDSVATLKIAVLTNVVNILLSLCFVFIFKMGIKGIGLGTAVSQWAGCLYGLFKVRKAAFGDIFSRSGTSGKSVGGLEASRKSRLRAYFPPEHLHIFLRTLCLVAVTLWFTRTGARMGADLLAANALLMQLFMLFSFFMDGFAYAGEALAGKLLGAGRREEIRILERDLLKWGVALSAVGMILYFSCGEWILGLLTDDGTVRTAAKDYLPWAVTVPLCGFMAFIYDGIFIGMSLTGRLLASMAVAMAVFFISYFIFYPSMGNHGLWLSFCLYLLTRGLLQSLLLRNTR